MSRYGLLLGYLQRAGRLDPTADTAGLVTPEAVAAFTAELKCPRQVRVWDEAILPSLTITVSRYDLSDLFRTFRREGKGEFTMLAV